MSIRIIIDPLLIIFAICFDYSFFKNKSLKGTLTLKSRGNIAAGATYSVFLIDLLFSTFYYIVEDSILLTIIFCISLIIFIFFSEYYIQYLFKKYLLKKHSKIETNEDIIHELNI